MNNHPHILLLQSIENSHNYDFESTLELALKKIAPREHLLVADSFSDSLSLKYATDFVSRTQGITVICNEFCKNDLAPFSAILNMIVRDKAARLCCINPIKKLEPFLKMKKGKAFTSEDTLIDYLSSLNESASD